MGLPIYFNQRFSENDSLNQRFGFNTSLNNSGNILCIGTYNSGVYIYQSGGESENLNGWFLNQKLTGETYQDTTEGYFGFNSKINGNGTTLIASAPLNKVNNNNYGQIFIYNKRNNAWNLSEKLTGINHTEIFNSIELFAKSLDINNNGDIIIAGSNYYDNSNETGLVYIYQKDISNWNLSRLITSNNNSFGNTLSLNQSGNILAIGAPYENQNSGKVYILNWQLPNQIELKNWELDEFAQDINGKYVYQNDINPPIGGITTGYKHDSLNSWIYFRADIYNRWELETDYDPNQWYNSSPDSGNSSILPLTGWRISNAQGTVNALTNGTIDYVLTEITGDYKVSNFGIDLDLNNSGDKLLIGSLNSNFGSGAAYLFTGDNINWNLSKKFTGDGGLYQNFGNKVILNGNGDVALISEYKDLNSNGTDAGAVYLFTNNNPWSLNKKITGDVDIDYGDNFGFSIALNDSGNIAAIGAIGNGVDDKGAVYVYSDSNIQYSNFNGQSDLIFGNKPADLLCPTKNLNNFLINLKGEENFSSSYNTKHKFILYKSGSISGYLPVYESDYLAYNSSNIGTYSGVFNSGDYKIKVKSIYNDTNISFPSLCNSGIQVANIIDLSYSNRSGLALFKSNSIIFKDFLNKNSNLNEVANVYFLDSLNVIGQNFTKNFPEFINSIKTLEPLEKTKEGVALNDAIDYAIYNLWWNWNNNKRKIINIITNNFPYIESDASDCEVLDPYFTNPIEIKYSTFLNKIATYSSNWNISFNFIYLDKELNDEIDKKNFFYNEKELKTLYAKAAQIGNGIFGDNNISIIANTALNLMNTLKKLPDCPFPLPIITSNLAKQIYKGDKFNYTITASGYYDRCSVTNLPVGLRLEGCTITGTLLTSGTFYVQICVTNSSGTTCETLIIFVNSSSSSSSPGPGPAPSPQCDVCKEENGYDGGVGNPSWCNRSHCEEKYGIPTFYWNCKSIVVEGNPPNEACGYSTYTCEKCMTYCDCKEMGYPLVFDSQCYAISCPAGKVGKRIWKTVEVTSPTNPALLAAAPDAGSHCTNQGRTLSCSECKCVSDE